MEKWAVRAMPGTVAVCLGLSVWCGGCSSGVTSGSGGSSGGGGTPDPGSSMLAKATFDAGDVDHLLLRTQFGVTTGARDSAASLGVPAFIDAMLNVPAVGSTAAESEAAQLLVNAGDPPGLEGKFPSGSDVAEWWLYLMMRSQTPFQERLALFWHDHFAVATSVLNSQERHWMVNHVNVLRGQGLGNFRDLLITLSRDEAMLEWLDGDVNVKGEPNENFAREFLELFTVGADNGYTEADIQEASRAFTGYRNRLDVTTGLRYMEFDPDRKDIFAKVVFGQILTGNGETADDFDVMADLTMATLDVATWLAEKLLLEFVTDAPTTAQIANLAAVIAQHGFEIRPVLRTLFLSEAFYSARGTMVRSPVDFAVGFIRSTGLQISPGTLRRELAAVAQLPSQPPSVFGWPQGPEWLAADGMVERANLARRVIADRTYQSSNGFGVTLPAGTPDAAEVVDHYDDLLGVGLAAAERSTLITYLNSSVQAGPIAVPDPFDPTESRHVDERVRGLLYILANHPGFLAR
ncbi:MAG: DUF1800 domain-containing protein [Planctomycetota bacterium]